MKPNRVATVHLAVLALAFLTLPNLRTNAQDPAPEAALAKPATSGFLDPYPEFKKGEKDFDLWSKDFRTWFDGQHGKGVKKEATPAQTP